MKTLLVFLTACLLVFTACTPISTEAGLSTPFIMTAQMSTVIAETPGPPPTEGPSPTPIPATPIPTLPSSRLSPTELKYRVLEQFPDFFFCDPDFYPIAREDEMVLAQQHFPELQNNLEEFQTILSHNGLSGATTFTNEQKLLIYREHKRLNAVTFDLTGEEFQFQIQTGLEGQQGSFVTGAIDGNGSIDIQQRDSSYPTCPICLAKGTLIDTPRGPVSVENLRVGDPVWTTNEAGERESAVILMVGSVRVPATHEVVHVILSDRRELRASPGHPLTDGRRLADLKVGDMLDGSRVLLVERLRYEGASTYDLLPSGATGSYWANGILMGSSIVEP